MSLIEDPWVVAESFLFLLLLILVWGLRWLEE
jgi:hypothetical protein